ncbi:hypothetical protein DIJ64_00990 [Mycobacterium leprae]|uniref:Uncharacterized protein n=1 Tax=Mycobacterium leprae TaxID=1769 RepID=A0AAD0KUU3_MYCLR|nr:hypothetical protein DIJ64_00990 [Mycobacterium leprae]OAR20137.1 hypothetical protein A8144_12010 [Mycobacterium leprae 3125609]OAX70246.1 hypothetical protein A3216_13125 [Mycobacterium leprae 7935681]
MVYEPLWRTIFFYTASSAITQTRQQPTAAALRLSNANKIARNRLLAKKFHRNSDTTIYGWAPHVRHFCADVDGGGAGQPRTCYVLGDAHKLPIDDETFRRCMPLGHIVHNAGYRFG